MTVEADLYNAALLLGPTGTGKTPVGELLERRGLWGRRAHHFDFGANLRTLASGEAARSPALFPSEGTQRFSAAEISFLQDVLTKGVLLEAESFYLALKILRNFIEKRQVGQEDWVILNGLPRHIGQAEGLQELLRVQAVIELAPPPDAILQRLKLNVGGDRAERSDDTEDLVLKKLAIYQQRTKPLVEWYRERGAKVMKIAVGARTTPEETWEEVRSSKN